MKVTFFIGVFLGLAAVLSLAGFYPLVDHPRLPSKTQVLANGGRAEGFLIRLPVDRITTVGNPASGSRAKPFPDAVALPEAFGATPLLLEHFKVRDIQGNVIGIAARHTTGTPLGVESTWSIIIPSRGAIMLAGADLVNLDAALAVAGYNAGESWDGDLRVQVGAEGSESGRIVWGSQEFENLDGTYFENWLITGVDPSGDLRGTIELDTVITHSL